MSKKSIMAFWNRNSGFDRGIKDSLGCDGAMVLKILHWDLVWWMLASSPGQNSCCLAFANMSLTPWCVAWSNSSTSSLSFFSISILFSMIVTPSRQYRDSFMDQKQQIVSGSSCRYLGNSFCTYMAHLFHVPNHPTIKTYHLNRWTVLLAHWSIRGQILSAFSVHLSVLWGWWDPNFPGLLLAVQPLHIGHHGVVHDVAEMRQWLVSHFQAD